MARSAHPMSCEPVANPRSCSLCAVLWSVDDQDQQQPSRRGSRFLGRLGRPSDVQELARMFLFRMFFAAKTRRNPTTDRDGEPDNKI